MDLSAIFCLDRKREKRYHKPQVNHYCDEEEEYLRSICRELSVGVRQLWNKFELAFEQRAEG